MPLVELLASIVEVEPSLLGETDGPGSLESWTSLKQLEVVVTLEETYGVSFSVPEIERLVNVRAIRECLTAKGVAGLA